MVPLNLRRTPYESSPRSTDQFFALLGNKQVCEHNSVGYTYIPIVVREKKIQIERCRDKIQLEGCGIYLIPQTGESNGKRNGRYYSGF